jgi:hypothetical protein
MNIERLTAECAARSLISILGASSSFMKSFRIALLAVAALPFASCVTHVDDEQLTPAPRSPAALTYFGGSEPHLRTWANFHFYPHAALELEDIDGRWAGHGAIDGHETTVILDEGSVIEHTTAHPQYYKLHFLLPALLQPGQFIPLRTVASDRPTSRQEHHSGTTDTYSLAHVGELAVGGMSGYDIPIVGPRHSNRIGTVTILSASPTTLTLKLDATIPLRLAYQRPETRYRLKVHRTYVLKRKRPESA